MKSKLLIFYIIIAVTLSLFILPASAEVVHVIDITRPVADTEIAENEIFLLYGECIYDVTTISLEYFDDEAGEYKPLKATDGRSTFNVGKGKIFAKDIKLKKGENYIKITAHTNTKESKENPEIFEFTITYSGEKKSSLKDVFDWMTGKD